MVMADASRNIWEKPNSNALYASPSYDVEHCPHAPWLQSIGRNLFYKKSPKQ